MAGRLPIAGVFVKAAGFGVAFLGLGLAAAQAAPKCPTEPMAIGVFGPLTGASADFGEMAMNSVKLAVKEYEDKGGCPITIKPFDSQGAAAQAPALAQRAVRDKSVIAIIGPQFSGEAKAAMPILNAGGLPSVTAVATNPALTKQGWTYFFRTSGNDANEGPADAIYMAKNLKAKKAGVVDNSTEYGKGIADYVRDTLKKNGVEVAVTEALDSKAPDYSATVNKLKAAGVDVVYCGCYYAEAARLLTQMRQGGVTATMVGPSGLYDHRFIATVGKANAEGVVSSTQAVAPGHFKGAEEFEARYKKLNNAEPLPYAPETYDATQAVLHAIQAGNVDRKSIDKWLADKCDFEGVSGRIKFNKEGNVAGGVTSFFVVKDGAYHYETSFDDSKLQ
jgi:branched-chain amino acid transport system substrate-binding protein